MTAADPMQLLVGMVLDDGRRWIEVATGQQRADAAAVFDLAGPRRHYLTRPRGGSKTTDVAAMALAVLIDQAPPASRSYVVAVDGEQAALLTDAATGLVQRSGLGRDVETLATSLVSRHNGASIEVVNADGASAFGLRPYLLVLDELAQWPTTPNHRRLYEALLSSIQKRPDSRLVAMTSAGDPAHPAAKLLAAAKASDRWRVSEMRGPVSWHDPAELAELRKTLLPSSYARLVLNEWTAPEDRLSTVDDVRACATRVESVLPPRRGVDYVMALDVGLTNDRTVIAVGHVERTDDDASMIVLDRIEVRQGSRKAKVDLVEVEAQLAELSRLYNGANVVVDPYQAVHIAQGLRRRHVRVREFTFSQSSTGRLGVLLFRLLRDGLLDLPADEELIDELASVRLRENAPGSFRLDHDQGRHDDRAVALALLAQELLEGRRSRRRSIVGVTIDGVTHGAQQGPTLDQAMRSSPKGGTAAVADGPSPEMSRIARQANAWLREQGRQ